MTAPSHTPVVVLGNLPWNDQWRRRQYLFAHLARFRDVYHLDPPFPLLDFLRHGPASRGEDQSQLPAGHPQPPGRPQAGPPPAIRRGVSFAAWRASPWSIRPDASGVRVVRGRPGLPGERFSPEVRRTNAALHRGWVRASLRRLAERHGVREPVLVCYDALIHPLDLEGLVRQRVYDLIDDYPVIAGAARLQKTLERRIHGLAKASDLTLVPNEALAERVAGSARRVEVLPHGVDIACFHPEAYRGTVFEELKRMPRPKAVYHGTLDDKLDPGFLEALLREGIVLLLAGQTAWPARRFAQLRRAGDLRCFGVLAPRNVAGLVAAADAGILPYRPYRGHERGGVLKYLEFCAAGLPVVATDIAPCRRCGEGLILAGAAGAFVAATVAASRTGGEGKERRLALARQNTWEERARRLNGWLVP
jgi:glycosyltransferase involved in cell wall biosynthesis